MVQSSQAFMPAPFIEPVLNKNTAWVRGDNSEPVIEATTEIAEIAQIPEQDHDMHMEPPDQPDEDNQMARDQEAHG